ncbi:adenosylcobinamide-GDP ribazoletransferase [Stakelama tenebrarum]|uniref:Adenosylcobinamide-GDP ribazoletransferase n=1 Tax=Stakelama tenebrarum TaxID=2711215 RepID=A0A6G6Y2C8_9SPHN|nr:adenosylcobinamide-GDP ribazoletransferase [Sphingosinithalassobacter tenebrarum]QIG79060.1 adenosylcobinamide-GDP ribazoletransferase [Sphingosinithalassobacter tenebrarum]
MTRLILALQLMTRLPLPDVKADSRDFAAAIRWFPAAGLIVGVGVAAATWIGALRDPWLGALFGLVTWVAVTGALHLDGLGDIADAVGAAHRDPERLIAILSDSRTGTFAVVVIGLQLAAKLVLLQCMAEAELFWPLIAIAAIARTGPLCWTRALPRLHDGLAARFTDGLTLAPLVLWVAASLLIGAFAPPLLIAPALWLAWGLWIRWRLGGISGDGHGAGIELVESALMLAVVIAA